MRRAVPLILVLASLLFLAGCPNPAGGDDSQSTVAVESITVEPAEIALEVNETAELTATVLPEDATDSAVTWSSSDDSVATVNSEGVVTGASVGEATVTATTGAGEVTASSQITVTEATGDGSVDTVLEGNEDPDVSINGMPDSVAQGSLFTASSSGYESYTWFLNADSGHSALSATGSSAQVDSGELSRGAHALSLFVSDGENTYSGHVTFIVTEPSPSQTLIDLPLDGTGGDGLGRGFYVEAYPGSTLDTVTVYIGTDQAGDYTISLTAREATYDGATIGSTQQTATISDGSGNVVEQNAFVFDFGNAPVTEGEIVTFELGLVSGAGGSVFYGTGTGMSDTGVTQTNGTTPPLDSFRRDGIAVTITGRL